MAHQDRPDTLALIGVDHDESDLGLAWLDNDIASAAGDDRVSIFIDFRDECDMISKSILRKKAISCSEKPFFGTKKRR